MREKPLTVVKIGGGVGIDPRGICTDVANGSRPVVVVHGASDRANRLIEGAGLQPQFLTSPSGHVSRYTNPQRAGHLCPSRTPGK